MLRNYIANPYKAATPKVNICSVAFKDQTLPQKKLINKFKPKKLSIKTPLKQKIYEVDETSQRLHLKVDAEEIGKKIQEKI